MYTIRDFEPADRYVYDFGFCSMRNGWAQVDTSQDASYFGIWANPERLQILTYCEGDVTIQVADSGEEFAAELRRIAEWNAEHGHKFKGIDPGFSESIATAFRELGLGDMLH